MTQVSHGCQMASTESYGLHTSHCSAVDTANVRKTECCGRANVRMDSVDDCVVARNTVLVIVSQCPTNDAVHA